MRAVDYVDLGRYLRDVRESVHVSVEQAAIALHIRPKYLHDLENGNLDAMPGKAYLRGYIKNYAEYLQLDSREVLEEYEKLFGGHSPQYFVPQAGVHSNMPTRSILWLCTAGLVAVYAVWYFLVYDHTAVENKIEDIPMEASAPPAVTMDASWQKCLNSNNCSCFLDKVAKMQPDDLKSPLIHAVPVPGMPVTNTSKEDGGDNKGRSKNDDNE